MKIGFGTVEDEKVEAELYDDDYNEIDDDDFEGFAADAVSSRRQLASYAVRSSYGEFRKSGVHQGGPIQHFVISCLKLHLSPLLPICHGAQDHQVDLVILYN